MQPPTALLLMHSSARSMVWLSVKEAALLQQVCVLSACVKMASGMQSAWSNFVTCLLALTKDRDHNLIRHMQQMRHFMQNPNDTVAEKCIFITQACSAEIFSCDIAGLLHTLLGRKANTVVLFHHNCRHADPTVI